jgi:hypothetical protein
MNTDVSSSVELSFGDLSALVCEGQTPAGFLVDRHYQCRMEWQSRAAAHISYANWERNRRKRDVARQ